MRDHLCVHRVQERTQDASYSRDELERENLRLRAGLQEKGALVAAAEGMIGQVRVQLMQAQEDATKALSQATCALALAQHGSGATLVSATAAHHPPLARRPRLPSEVSCHRVQLALPGRGTRNSQAHGQLTVRCAGHAQDALRHQSRVLLGHPRLLPGVAPTLDSLPVSLLRRIMGCLGAGRAPHRTAHTSPPSEDKGRRSMDVRGDRGVLVARRHHGAVRAQRYLPPALQSESL